MKTIIALVFGFLGFQAYSQMPDTDIFLANISILGDSVQCTKPVNITQRAGYDNQPSFYDDNTLLYTSRRGEQTDIFTFNIKNLRTDQLTVTPESEYSAVKSAQGFTVVRVEQDSSQYLWSYPLSNKKPTLLIKTPDKVGYYTTIDSGNYAVFLLTKPFSLQVYNLKSGSWKKIAENPGRCLKMIPNTTLLSFMDKTNEQEWVIKAWNYKTDQIQNLCTALKGSEDFVWLNNKQMLAGNSGKLYMFDLSKKKPWKEVADLRTEELMDFQRIALSPKHNFITVVSKP